jgi:hypothetical protein
MKGNARDYQTSVAYDEAEARRRMWEAYSFMLEIGRERRLRNEQAKAMQCNPAASEGLV